MQQGVDVGMPAAAAAAATDDIVLLLRNLSYHNGY